jgi:biofilm PGA synthesis N-glycosyltransferase PgaC
MLESLAMQPQPPAAAAAGAGDGRVIVILPAHNEEATIGRTLQSLRAQTRRPDEIIVVCDNCTDATEVVSAGHGAHVLMTVGNTARKAGAINQALNRVLPRLDRRDLVLVMDADSMLCRDWIRCAEDALRRDRKLGGVCGTYTGEGTRGLLAQLQRNEFVRATRLVPRRAALWVLSGTGTMFRVPVIREVARERGRRIPGVPGQYYSTVSITEDYEITLALKTLGFRCLAAPGCTAETELMPTWRYLYRQRLRWQSGTLTALRIYGFTRATWSNWARQAFFYVRYCAQMACWAIIGYSLAAQPRLWMPMWTLEMLAIIYLERIVTVRKAGLKGILLAVLLIPEWCYGMFDGLYLFHALRIEVTGGDPSWGHVVRKDHAWNVPTS